MGVLLGEFLHLVLSLSCLALSIVSTFLSLAIRSSTNVAELGQCCLMVLKGMGAATLGLVLIDPVCASDSRSFIDFRRSLHLRYCVWALGFAPQLVEVHTPTGPAQLF